MDDEGLDEYERLSGVGSRSISPSSEDVESVSEQSTMKERWNSDKVAYRNTNRVEENGMEDGTQFWSQRLRVLSQLLSSVDGTSSHQSDDRVPAKTPTQSQLRQPWSKQTSTYNNVESTPIVSYGRSEFSKDSQTAKSLETDRRVVIEEQADTKEARVTSNKDDVESLRLDRGAKSERFTASLLEALTRSTHTRW